MPFTAPTQTNGIKLYYDQSGQGPDLLLIGGLSGHSRGWALQQPVFARDFRVTVFDNRGAGRSDAPDEPYSIRQMADDTASLLAALGIRRAHVLGHSMGGMIAQELAINYPGVVDRLVLASTRQKAGAIRQRMAPVDRWLREQGIDRVGNTLLNLPWSMTPTFMADEPRVLQMLEFARLDPYPIRPHAYLRQHAAVLAHETTGRLDRIAALTLILVGAEDILTPVSESAALATEIPGSQLQVLPRGGHGFFAEYPDETNAAVLDFLLAE